MDAVSHHCRCCHHREPTPPPPVIDSIYGIKWAEWKKVKDAADARKQTLEQYVASHADMEKAIQLLALELSR